MAMNTELLITLQQLKGIGSKTILELANNFTVHDIGGLRDSWHLLKGKRFTNITDDELKEAHHRALRIIDASEQDGIGILSYYEDAFPQALRHCVSEEGKLDPPLVLYYRGNLNALTMPAVAVIGTRTPTPNGVAAGHHVASQLAEKGFNIVSGLALGCDTAGHEGALDAGGITTAFLAGSLSWRDVYPQENLSLAERIVNQGGLLLSEYPLGFRSNRYAFVARDRLQAGLSCATAVVQTGITGGTMHAVRATITAGKPLYAIQFKHPEDLCHTIVQGNRKLMDDGFAMPLSSDNVTIVAKRLRSFIQRPRKSLNLFGDEKYDFWS